MKVLIFSDLHGKIQNIQTFLSEYEGISHVVFAGDFLGYFVVDYGLADFVKKLRPEFVIGNHDVYYVRKMFGEGAVKAVGPISSQLMSNEEYQDKYGALLETCRQTRADDFRFLQNAALQQTVTIDGLKFRICHGSPENPFDGYVYPDDTQKIEQFYQQLGFDVLVLGHTHKPFISSRDGRCVVNPGSCTLPRGEAQAPSVIVYETSERKATIVPIEQKLKFKREGKNKVQLLD
jgi:putative phosphoesterase